jgi:hypothetical protein
VKLFGRTPDLSKLREVDMKKVPLVTPAELLQRYEVVSVAETQEGSKYLVVSEPGSGTEVARNTVQLAESDTNVVPYYELGSSSPNAYTSWWRREYNPQLFGREGIRKYNEMRRSDGVVRGTLRKVKTPVLDARWRCRPFDHTKTIDVNAADMVWWNLSKGMTITWQQVLQEAMLMADYGYYMFEMVWDYLTMPNGKEILGLRKLAPRHPGDVVEWLYDTNGGPDAVVFPPNDLSGENVVIPIDKLLTFTFDREAGDMCGISVLRSAYKHWYYKDVLYRIDAIQKERHSVGIPIIKLPPGFGPQDRTDADDLGRNLRTNEKAHVVLPPNWEIMMLELQGHPVDVQASIVMHDDAIRENILSEFSTDTGTAVKEKQIVFTKATRFLANSVSNTFNAYCIPQLVEANYKRASMPELIARKIGEEEEQRTWSFTVRNLVGAGVIRPDDKLEDEAREVMDLPPADTKTARLVNPQDAKNQGLGFPPVPAGYVGEVDEEGGNAKQKGAIAGGTRQQPLPPQGTPNGNAGTDRSGGK